MAQHNTTGENSAGIQGFAKQSSAVSVTEMVMRAGIGMLAKEGGIMVGFHEDEIGIGEPGLQVLPIPKIRGDHDFSLPGSSGRADIEAEGCPYAVMEKSKGLDEERTDLEGLQGKRTHLQAEEGALAKMDPGKEANLPLININGNIFFFQHPEGIMVDVIIVEMGEEDPVDLGWQSVQSLAAAAHGAESGINQNVRIFRLQKQAVPRAAAAEGLKGKAHPIFSVPLIYQECLLFHPPPFT